MKKLSAESIFGALNQQPFVKLSFEEKEVLCSPEEARHHAQAIIEAAEAAEQDAFIVHFFQKHLDLPLEKAALVLREYRQFREAMQNRQEG